MPWAIFVPSNCRLRTYLNGFLTKFQFIFAVVLFSDCNAISTQCIHHSAHEYCKLKRIFQRAQSEEQMTFQEPHVTDSWLVWSDHNVGSDTNSWRKTVTIEKKFIADNICVMFREKNIARLIVWIQYPICFKQQPLVRWSFPNK